MITYFDALLGSGPPSLLHSACHLPCAAVDSRKKAGMKRDGPNYRISQTKKAARRAVPGETANECCLAR